MSNNENGGGAMQRGLSACPTALQVALLAVSAVTAGLGHVLEEQQFVKRPDREKRLILEGPLAETIQGEEGARQQQRHCACALCCPCRVPSHSLVLLPLTGCSSPSGSMQGFLVAAMTAFSCIRCSWVRRALRPMALAGSRVLLYLASSAHHLRRGGRGGAVHGRVRHARGGCGAGAGCHHRGLLLAAAAPGGSGEHGKWVEGWAGGRQWMISCWLERGWVGWFAARVLTMVAEGCTAPPPPYLLLPASPDASICLVQKAWGEPCTSGLEWATTNVAYYLHGVLRLYYGDSAQQSRPITGRDHDLSPGLAKQASNIRHASFYLPCLPPASWPRDPSSACAAHARLACKLFWSALDRSCFCCPPACLQVRVLQCVSVAVELMGDKLKPHLATITTALPQVNAVLLLHCCVVLSAGQTRSWIPRGQPSRPMCCLVWRARPAQATDAPVPGRPSTSRCMQLSGHMIAGWYPPSCRISKVTMRQFLKQPSMLCCAALHYRCGPPSASAPGRTLAPWPACTVASYLP
jgi:hypothetical protein